MKWRTPKLTEGDTRTRTKFALWPKRLTDGNTVWLEYYEIAEEVRRVALGGYGAMLWPEYYALEWRANETRAIAAGTRVEGSESEIAEKIARGEW